MPLGPYCSPEGGVEFLVSEVPLDHTVEYDLVITRQLDATQLTSGPHVV